MPAGRRPRGYAVGGTNPPLPLCHSAPNHLRGHWCALPCSAWASSPHFPPSLPPSPPLLTIWSLVITAIMHPPCTVLPSGDQAMERTRASLQGGVGVEEGRW